ncbi:hypothetical protein [Paenibacillus xylanexedens]|uniref:hypothetical protein n=1 Tax=Paenibacillus xylanexedens TaxID=528191 RepID=UPI0011A15AF3|nr:hypothetical protein [Paenibacillus xylanexedens]
MTNKTENGFVQVSNDELIVGRWRGVSSWLYLVVFTEGEAYFVPEDRYPLSQEQVNSIPVIPNDLKDGYPNKADHDNVLIRAYQEQNKLQLEIDRLKKELEKANWQAAQAGQLAKMAVLAAGGEILVAEGMAEPAFINAHWLTVESMSDGRLLKVVHKG